VVPVLHIRNFRRFEAFEIIYNGAYLEPTAVTRIDMKNQNLTVLGRLNGRCKHFNSDEEKEKLIIKIYLIS
jgi:hypothetical protein